ncbi:3-phenylpropionate/cinnamic acid dioxygenase ferredoxin--NAD(+) reductase component [Sodalis praecaptivus]
MTLKDGQRIEATLVLLATGVAPATRFIHDLPLNDDGSLTVDRTMKVSADIFAIGDIATFPLDGNPTRIEHWRVAQQHGRVAAGAMMDKPHPDDAVPFFGPSIMAFAMNIWAMPLNGISRKLSARRMRISLSRCMA